MPYAIPKRAPIESRRNAKALKKPQMPGPGSLVLTEGGEKKAGRAGRAGKAGSADREKYEKGEGEAACGAVDAADAAVVSGEAFGSATSVLFIAIGSPVFDLDSGSGAAGSLLLLIPYPNALKCSA